MGIPAVRVTASSHHTYLVRMPCFHAASAASSCIFDAGLGLQIPATMSVEDDVEKSVPSNRPPSHTDDGLGDQDAARRADDDFQPPDGGLLAWSQVFAGCLLNTMAWGYPSTFGVYQLYYRDTLRLPEAQISWIGSLQVFLAFAMCTVSGRLADAGYVKSTIVGGSSLVVFGTFMTSLASEYWQIFLAQGLCTGLGLGIIFMPPLSVINSYFKTKKASAMAVAATGTGLGSVIFPATIQYLIPQVGFQWAVRCAAFVALFISTLAVLIVRPQLKPRKSGPLVEWDAFKEGPYCLYTFGAFLFFWALYFGFFYVSATVSNTAIDNAVASCSCCARSTHMRATSSGSLRSTPSSSSSSRTA